MTMTKTALFLISMAGLGAGTALAQAPPAAAPAATLKPSALGLAVYPGSGQDATKQAADEAECYTWARQQTSIDPTVTTQAAAVEPAKGGAVKGAARGAARGAVVGAAGNDEYQRDEGNLSSGEGAGAGAAVGAAQGRRAQKKGNKQAEAQAQEAAKATDAASKETFKKSWAACLGGRGYSVK